MDFGKFKYQEQKKAHEPESRSRFRSKEVKLRPGTDEGDYQIKLRNLTALPGRKATRCKVTCASAVARWRTRSSACASWRVKADLEGNRPVEQMPKMEGAR